MSEVVFKKGLERNLPLSAAEGDIFFTKDTGRIFMGMGDGEPLLEMGGDGLAPGIVAYFGAELPPKGWLKADGSIVSRLEYPKLFQAIGTTFGEGDGETTFQIPDLRGEFLRGWDDGRGVDTDRELGAPQKSTELGWENRGMSGSIPRSILNPDSIRINTTKGASMANSVAATISEHVGLRPRNIALLACIRY